MRPASLNGVFTLLPKPAAVSPGWGTGDREASCASRSQIARPEGVSGLAPESAHGLRPRDRTLGSARWNERGAHHPSRAFALAGNAGSPAAALPWATGREVR
eukprot:4148619-Prymnesium_polylepis.1